MAQRIVVHIGAMKSATTYLQNLCDVNVEALAHGGIYWPGSRQIFSATTRAHDPSIGDWKTLLAEVHRHDGTALISNELLSLRRTRRIRTMLDDLGTGVEVVITARDLGRVIPSQWHTGTRNRRSTPPWPDFIAALVADDHDEPEVDWFWRRHDLPTLIDTWASMLSPDRITVVTVPPAGADPGVIADRFMSLAGIDASTLAPPTWRSPTYGIVTSEFMRRLSSRLEHLNSAQYREFAALTIARAIVAAPQPPEPAVLLTRDQMAWARERARAMVSEIAASGVSVVGDLDDLIPPADAPTAAGIPEPTEAELLDVAMRALGAAGAAWPTPGMPDDLDDE